MSVRALGFGRGVWIAAGIALAVVLAAIGLGVGWPRRPAGGTGIVVKTTPEGVIVDLGQVYSTEELAEITVPLTKVGITSSQIASKISSCGCLIASSEGEVLRLRFNPFGKAGKVRETVRLIPQDSSMAQRLVHIDADVIPGWYVQPPAIKIDAVAPEERRVFRCEARIEHDMPAIVVQRCEAKPTHPWLTLHPVVGTDHRSIVVEGQIIGGKVRESYEGTLNLVIGPEPFQQVSIPMTITHTGLVWADPEVVTLSGTKNREGVEVVCFHARGESLRVDRIESPDSLTVTANMATGQCRLRIERKGGGPTPSAMEQADVMVHFAGIDTPLAIHVLCLP